MPLGLEDLDNPDFKQLPPEDQHQGRREVYQNLIRTDPDFRQLPPEERQKVLFPEAEAPNQARPRLTVGGEVKGGLEDIKNAVTRPMETGPSFANTPADILKRVGQVGLGGLRTVLGATGITPNIGNLATSAGEKIQDVSRGTILSRPIPGTNVAPSDIAAGLTSGTIETIGPNVITGIVGKAVQGAKALNALRPSVQAEKATEIGSEAARAKRLSDLVTEQASFERPAMEAQGAAAKAAVEGRTRTAGLEAGQAQAQRSLAEQAQTLRQSQSALEKAKTASVAPNEEAVGRVADSLLSKPVTKKEAGQFFQSKYKDFKKAAANEGGARYDAAAEVGGDQLYGRPEFLKSIDAVMEESGTLKNSLASAPRRIMKDVQGEQTTPLSTTGEISNRPNITEVQGYLQRLAQDKPSERLAKLQGVAEGGGREPTIRATPHEAAQTKPSLMPEGGGREQIIQLSPREALTTEPAALASGKPPIEKIVMGKSGYRTNETPTAKPQGPTAYPEGESGKSWPSPEAERLSRVYLRENPAPINILETKVAGPPPPRPDFQQRGYVQQAKAQLQELQSKGPIALEEGFFEKYKKHFPPKRPGEPDIMPAEVWSDLTSGGPKATVGDMILDRQKIRAAKRAAESTGRYNEARQLGILEDGITTDLKTSSPKVTTAIEKADAFWRDEYIPRFGYKALPTKGAKRAPEDVVNFFFRKESSRDAEVAAEALTNTVKNPGDMARLSRSWLDGIVKRSQDKTTGQFNNDAFLKEYLGYPDRVREIAAGGTKAKQQLDEIAQLMQQSNVGNEAIGRLEKTVRQGETSVKEGARSVAQLAGQNPNVELEAIAREVSRTGKQQQAAEAKVLGERATQAKEVEKAAKPSELVNRFANRALVGGALSVAYGLGGGRPSAMVAGGLVIGAGELTRLLSSPKGREAVIGLLKAGGTGTREATIWGSRAAALLRSGPNPQQESQNIEPLRRELSARPTYEPR